MMNNKDLLLEAHKINYQLRSSFFYNKLIEYHTYEFPEIINRLLPMETNYSWADSKGWGITDTAFHLIEKSQLHFIQVFCHPRLLREHPTLSAYYRNVSALSQKSVHYLAGIDVKKCEDYDNTGNINQAQSLALSCLYNTHISIVIDNALQGFEEKHIRGMLFASTGAQIDGSWRNRIGDEAEKVVRKMLIRGAIERNQLSAFLLKDNIGGVERYIEGHTAELDGRVDEFRGFMLNNQRSILFSSEPDLSLLDKDGKTIAVIEVKGGSDPAGALERYGAAKKSFEEAFRQNEKVKTILVASCITHEVETRITSDPTIHEYHNLTELMTIDESKTKFLNHIFKEIMKCQ